MTHALQIGQFAIVDHEPVERGPNAGVFLGKGPVGDRSELYVVAEGTTPAGEAFVGHLISTLGQAWSTYDVSLTGSLSRLFAEASRDLRDWNRKSIAQHRVRIGMTCFARRGNQAVIAQAGPSSAYLWHNGACTPIVPSLESSEPMGGPKDTPLALTRIDLEPGDSLLLLSTSAAIELDDDLLCDILALPGEQVLRNLFRRTDHVRNMTAMLIAREEEEVAPQPKRGRESDAIIDAVSRQALPAPQQRDLPSAEDPFQPSLFVEQGGERAMTAAREQLHAITPRASISADMPPIDMVVPEPLRRVSGDDSFAQMAADHGARASLAAGNARMYGNGSGAVTYPRDGSTRMVDPGSRSRRKASFTRSLAPNDLPMLPDISETAATNVTELAHDRQATLLGATWVEPLIEPGQATVSAAPLVRTKNQVAPRFRSGGHRIDLHPHVRRPWLVVVIGLCLFVGIVSYLVLPNMLSEQSSKRYEEQVNNAEQQLGIARVQQDPGARRTALTTAQAYLLEARDMSQAGAEVERMLTEVTSGLTALDNIKAPQTVEVVASLVQFGDRPVAAARLVASEDEAFILDTASSQVISVGLAAGDYRAVFAQRDDEKRGKPVAITLMEGTDLGVETLVIADDTNNLWAYSPGAPLRLLALSAPANFSITDIASLGRDLYVLDSGNGSIYRFASNSEGFTSQPVKVVDNPALAKARRLAVDGEILTSDGDGTIHRFSGQLSLSLSQAGIDEPLVSDQTPQLLTTNGDIAIADSANDRIVVLKRDGTFDRQYQQKDFAKLSTMTIRDDAVYVFSGGVLRRVVL